MAEQRLTHRTGGKTSELSAALPRVNGASHAQKNGAEVASTEGLIRARMETYFARLSNRQIELIRSSSPRYPDFKASLFKDESSIDWLEIAGIFSHHDLSLPEALLGIQSAPESAWASPEFKKMKAAFDELAGQWANLKPGDALPAGYRAPRSINGNSSHTHKARPKKASA